MSVKKKKYFEDCPGYIKITLFPFMLQMGMGGDNRAPHQGAYVCQPDHGRVCLGSATRGQNVSTGLQCSVFGCPGLDARTSKHLMSPRTLVKFSLRTQWILKNGRIYNVFPKFVCGPWKLHMKKALDMHSTKNV